MKKGNKERSDSSSVHGVCGHNRAGTTVRMYMPVQCACYRMHAYRDDEGLPKHNGTTYAFVRSIQRNARGEDTVQDKQVKGMISNSMSRYLGVDCPSPSPVKLGQHSPPLRFAVSSERKRRLCHHILADLRRRDMHACDIERIGRACIYMLTTIMHP